MPSIRNFIARLPRPLADTFLQRHKIFISPETMGSSDQIIADEIEVQLVDSPPGTRGALSHDMELVEQLSTPNGKIAIDDVTNDDNLSDLPSRQARALWVFLNDPEAFRRAEEIVYNDDHRHGRSWSSFGSERARDVRRDSHSVEEFKKALRVLFDSPNVHVEIFDRSRPPFFDTESDDVANGNGNSLLVQITIYREDRPNAEPAFVEGELTMQTRRPVLEAAVTYDAVTGSIECVAPHKASRKEIVESFAAALLGCPPDVQPIANTHYDLTVLSSRRQFETDPEDLIETVSVSMLRLQPLETSMEQVSVERWWKSERDIWSVAGERLGENALAADYNITQAKIVVRYRSAESNRVRSLAVMISHPNRSNIKDQREIDRLVANKYLPRWGIAPSA